MIDTQEIEHIKELFITSIEKLQFDYQAGLFEVYTPSSVIPQVYGVEVKSIDDALAFLLYHEELHAGYIIALKHLV